MPVICFVALRSNLVGPVRNRRQSRIANQGLDTVPAAGSVSRACARAATISWPSGPQAITLQGMRDAKTIAKKEAMKRLMELPPKLQASVKGETGRAKKSERSATDQEHDGGSRGRNDEGGRMGRVVGLQSTGTSRCSRLKPIRSHVHKIWGHHRTPSF